MGVMTMKEAIAETKRLRKQAVIAHKIKHQHDGLCSGLTDKEYNRVVYRQKSSFSKARKFTHSKMWQETHKKFDTRQLRIIKKV